MTQRLRVPSRMFRKWPRLAGPLAVLHKHSSIPSSQFRHFPLNSSHYHPRYSTPVAPHYADLDLSHAPKHSRTLQWPASPGSLHPHLPPVSLRQATDADGQSCNRSFGPYGYGMLIYSAELAPSASKVTVVQLQC